MADDDETGAGAATAAADEPADHDDHDGRDDDRAGDDRDEDDAGARAGDEAGDEATPRSRPVLDGRTIAICALIALVAALATGVGLTLAGFGQEDEPEPEARLTEAVEVPDIGLPALEGGAEVSLAAYAGQPMVVNFWGSWCVPCVEEMPDLQRVHESLGDTVAFVGVNVNDAEEAARSMTERTGVTYDLVRDADGELIRALDITTFPTTVLVAADGTIVDTVRRQVSAERLCEKINQSLLNQQLEECG